MKSLPTVMPKIKGIYAVIDTAYVSPEETKELASKILSAGALFLQLRAKELSSGAFLGVARELRKLTSSFGATFVVNDRADIAMLAGADGVHLGQEDLPAETVRGLIGKNKIIGLSTHNLKEAIEADMLAKKGVIDYISYGPVFPTKTKVDARPTVGIEGLREAKKFVTAPLVAIGGITEETLFETILAGADAVSIVSDILTAKDIRSKVERLTRAF